MGPADPHVGLVTILGFGELEIAFVGGQGGFVVIEIEQFIGVVQFVAGVPLM